MTKSIDLTKYNEFVDGITSDTSKDFDLFLQRMTELNNQGMQVSRLITASVGLSGETGEFNEVVKKIVFHGKVFDNEKRLHLKKELGDVIWYWIQACLALELDPNDVIAENVEKLEGRYPGGKFDPWYSENRQNGDI